MALQNLTLQQCLLQRATTIRPVLLSVQLLIQLPRRPNTTIQAVATTTIHTVLLTATTHLVQAAIHPTALRPPPTLPVASVVLQLKELSTIPPAVTDAAPPSTSEIFQLLLKSAEAALKYDFKPTRPSFSVASN